MNLLNNAIASIVITAATALLLCMSACNGSSDDDKVNSTAMSVVVLLVQAPGSLGNPSGHSGFTQFKDEVAAEVNACTPHQKSQIRNAIDQYMKYQEIVANDLMAYVDSCFAGGGGAISASPAAQNQYKMLLPSIQTAVPPPNESLSMMSAQVSTMTERLAGLSKDQQQQFRELMNGQMVANKSLQLRLINELLGDA